MAKIFQEDFCEKCRRIIDYEVPPPRECYHQSEWREYNGIRGFSRLKWGDCSCGENNQVETVEIHRSDLENLLKIKELMEKWSPVLSQVSEDFRKSLPPLGDGVDGKKAGYG